ncbi:hypothetical protein [Pedobacter zeae]|uniref:Uncharacterized protein n=1 Tax=Pedobacter zeae TaxID=1737356 RepID=A0A7W6K9F0_9SPHI|nr:hypothetical protein [Pedobacter zeae]MBB4107638.1 hypothetical protein [Pedobacter zeae]GGG98021.1 hypothetical protein GCM10007422_10110 [Pedobacter zeae]
MSNKLIELFSEEYRRKHAEELVKADSIIILEIPEFHINHEKFIILLTSSIKDDEFSAVCINSNPSPGNNHVVIHPNDYQFLDHLSHIDCGSIVAFSKQYLKDLLFREPHRYKGSVTEVTYIDIMLKVSQSITITDEQREKFNL